MDMIKYDILTDPKLKELERKAKKAVNRNFITVEEIRYAKAKAKIWANIFFVYNSRENLLMLLRNLIKIKKVST
jgi:hypothetical protein